jgi:hypothetical protein
MSKSIIFATLVLTLFAGRVAIGPVATSDTQMAQAQGLVVVDPSF